MKPQKLSANGVRRRMTKLWADHHKNSIVPFEVAVIVATNKETEIQNRCPHEWTRILPDQYSQVMWRCTICERRTFSQPEGVQP